MNTRKRAKTMITKLRRRRARIEELKSEWHKLRARKTFGSYRCLSALRHRMKQIDKAMDHHYMRLEIDEKLAEKVYVA